jgi:hypothetical protein
MERASVQWDSDFRICAIGKGKRSTGFRITQYLAGVSLGGAFGYR